MNKPQDLKDYELKFGSIQNKKLFRCIKEYASEPDVYGIDFIKNKLYFGEKEDNEYYYVDSTENGTCVLISNKELSKHFERLID